MDEHSGLSEIIIQSPVSYLVDDWGDSEFGDDRYRGTPGYLEFVKEQIISSYSILERVSYDTKKPFSTTALFGEYILRKAERLCKGFFSSSWEETFFGEQIATKARADTRADTLDKSASHVFAECLLANGGDRENTLIREDGTFRETKIFRKLQGYRVVAPDDYQKESLSLRVSESLVTRMNSNDTANIIVNSSSNAVIRYALQNNIPPMLIVSPWGVVISREVLGYHSEYPMDKILLFQDNKMESLPDEDYFRAFSSVLLSKILARIKYPESLTISKMIFGYAHAHSLVQNAYGNTDAYFELCRRFQDGELINSWDKTKQNRIPFLRVQFAFPSNHNDLGKW